MKKTKVLVAIFVLAAFAKVQAQDTSTDSHTLGVTIPSVAIVDIEPSASKNIAMIYTAPIEAGLPIQAPANNTTLWINYSYIPTLAAKTATVSAKISALVDGLNINLQAGASAGAGGGTKGTSAGIVTLGTTNQVVINNIGASYTGDGINNGHNLTYSLDAVSAGAVYANLIASNPSLTVTYTIAEN